MFGFIRTVVTASVFAIMAACSTPQPPGSPGATATDPVLDHEAQVALQRLYANTPEAESLAQQAKGILVFPEVLKAGLLVGGHRGKGVLFENGSPSGYYATTAISYGLQAGAQTFGYAMFLMSSSALEEIKTSPGFEVGVGPSIVVVDQGTAKSLTSSALNSDIYAFIFNQKGLMAGLGLQGSKITKINP